MTQLFAYTSTTKPKIAGTSQDREMSEHNAFPLLSFNLEAFNDVDVSSGASSTGGRTQLMPVTIVKEADSASVGLFTAMAQGVVLDDFVIEMRLPAVEGERSKPHLKFELHEVRIINIEFSADEGPGASDIADGGAIQDEQITLKYGAIEMTVFESNPRTGKLTSSSSKWSEARNSASTKV